MSTFSFEEIHNLEKLLQMPEEPDDKPRQGADYKPSTEYNTAVSSKGSSASNIVTPGDIGSKNKKSTITESASTRVRKKKYDKYVIWTDEEVDNEEYFEPPDDRTEPQFISLFLYFHKCNIIYFYNYYCI